MGINNLGDKVNNKNEEIYFYAINYPQKEKELCHLEMKILFGVNITKKYFFSHKNIDPSRSPFVKFRITIVHSAPTLDLLVQTLKDHSIAYNNFKFARFKIEDEKLDYPSWLVSAHRLGYVIRGNVDMKNPSIQLGTTIVDGRWIFGIYEKNENKWQTHNLKPYTNSNSLETRTARAIVNIATGNMDNPHIVDPCCGVGTVVLEALSIGINVEGFELHYLVAQQAKKNIAYFGYPNCITKGDMHEIDRIYDVAIVDLPYGLFTASTHTEQQDIINTSRRITKKLVIVTSSNMDEQIILAGFTIIERCRVHKGRFVRYVRLCT